jgi:hypothetical protein
MVTSAQHLAFVANDIAMNITSKIVALSSVVAFALQIALALLMLRCFSPEEVGTFSVISQIGFFWTTLALSQAPLRLLANQGLSATEDTRDAWESSLQRFFVLLPVAALAVWWSGISFFYAFLWALVLSLCQIAWMLAQTMRLRMVNAWPNVCVRILPPLTALLFISMTVLVDWQGPALFYASTLGYVVGAFWLTPALFVSADTSRAVHSQAPETFAVDTVVSCNVPNCESIAVMSADTRSAKLRTAHTLADAVLSTMIVLVWQRLYGSQETGWLAAPLRVMGFIPALVHMSWSQVLLAQRRSPRINSFLIGLGGFIFIAMLGTCCTIALETGLLDSYWQGVQPYLLPLVLWQGSACFSAAFSHRPFEMGTEVRYSLVCILVIFLQFIILVLPLIFSNLLLTANDHMGLFASVSTLSLIFIAYKSNNFRIYS